MAMELAYIAQYLSAWAGHEAIQLGWFACREKIEDPDNDFCVKNVSGIAPKVFQAIYSTPSAWPSLGNSTQTPVAMLKPGDAVPQVQAYMAWTTERVRHGVIPDVFVTTDVLL